MQPNTVVQLTTWMQVNCYHFNNYNLNNDPIYEGFGLELRAGTWIWYYTERGHEDVIARFNTEQEAVAYAFKAISDDKTAKTHIIGFVKDTKVLKELIDALEERNIEFSQAVIPYTREEPKDRYMVFVFGCDINKVADLKEKYYVIK